MSEFLGSRISLISKSDIRYVGVLHEINSDESTVSLENVRSFGTEGRRGKDEIGPSDQVYEYIVFRGSDVKDLRIEEHPGIKENKPPMPDDPAIVGATRSRPHPPGPNQDQNAPPPGLGPFSQYPPGQFYGPPGAWGRGGPPGPMPNPGFGGNMPYPPPPGWFPPGQAFPHGPGGLGGPGGPRPWQNQPFPPGPGGPPGPDDKHIQRGPPNVGPPALDGKHAPIGPGPSEPATPAQSTEQKPLARPLQNAPTPPVESKPSKDEVKAVAAGLDQVAKAQEALNAAPTAPKNNRVHPVVPLSGSLSKPFQTPASMEKIGQTRIQTTVTTVTQNSVQDATSAARAAVAVAMAQLGNTSSAMDNLTSKVNEMRVNAARGGSHLNRGRGRGGKGIGHKVEVPGSDFDFMQSNAKFNTEDVMKEAIAGGSPLPETPNDGGDKELELEANPIAYNKTKSFFDNISSEAKDRAENGPKPGGREWRGEEQRKNMETFGQGSVDGGLRGRGRGRGGRGGRGRGFGRGGRGGNRPQFNTTAAQ